MASKPSTVDDSAVKDLQKSHLEWIQVKNELQDSYGVQSNQQTLVEKFSKNPFVPIGCLATVGALVYGIWSFRQGRSRTSQKMMRLRIAAQGFTVIAMGVGVFMTGFKQ